MFLEFFIKLKASNLPVSLNEYLTLLKALQLNFIQYDIEEFYFLTRTTLIKNENLIDKFDVIFGEHFKSIEKIQLFLEYFF
mgnify:CR=1 FL=1